MGKTKIQEWHLRRPIIVESTPFRVEPYRPSPAFPSGASRVCYIQTSARWRTEPLKSPHTTRSRGPPSNRPGRRQARQSSRPARAA